MLMLPWRKASGLRLPYAGFWAVPSLFCGNIQGRGLRYVTYCHFAREEFLIAESTKITAWRSIRTEAVAPVTAGAALAVCGPGAF